MGELTIEARISAAKDVAERILPRNATPFEKAVFCAELARLAALNPYVIADIWNPMKAPAELLPWLAWALSVDVWDDEWTEQKKRAVIQASPIVHRLKGTLGAVERALAAFDLSTNIVEWWQDGSRRGTFRVEMIYQNGGPVFDPVVQREAIESVKAAKPKSRVVTSRSVILARGPQFIGAFAKSAFLAIAHPYAFTGDTQRAPIYVGAVSASFFTATAHPKE